jgi:hypothetical protein
MAFSERLRPDFEWVSELGFALIFVGYSTQVCGMVRNKTGVRVSVPSYRFRAVSHRKGEGADASQLPSAHYTNTSVLPNREGIYRRMVAQKIDHLKLSN